MLNRKHTPARKVGKLNGKIVSRFQVLVFCNNSRALKTESIWKFSVLSHNANDAVNMVRDIFGTRPETEIETMGARGGIISRFVGWYSAIGNEITEPRNQLTFQGPGFGFSHKTIKTIS